MAGKIERNGNLKDPNAEEVMLFGREKDQRSCTASNAALLSGGQLPGVFLVFPFPLVSLLHCCSHYSLTISCKLGGPVRGQVKDMNNRQLH